MAKLTLEIITGERLLLREEDVDEVVAPGMMGELGLLPNHAPLFTSLQAGELRVKKSNAEDDFFISGGFLEVKGDIVTVLADAAERGEEIDLERAEQAASAPKSECTTSRQEIVRVRKQRCAAR